MGLQALKEKGGFETTMVENIPSADSESAARDFANRGWELIFGHGFEFRHPAGGGSAGGRLQNRRRRGVGGGRRWGRGVGRKRLQSRIGL